MDALLRFYSTSVSFSLLSFHRNRLQGDICIFSDVSFVLIQQIGTLYFIRRQLCLKLFAVTLYLKDNFSKTMDKMAMGEIS